MEIKESRSFSFNHAVDGVNYGFSVLAESKELACEKLLKALGSISDELKGILKASTKAN